MARADLLTLWGHVSTRRRRQLILVALLMPATALAEMAMVGSLIPFLALLAGQPSRSFEVLWLNSLEQSAAALTGHPLLAAALFFVMAAIAAAALRLALTWHSERFAYGLGHDLALEIQRRLLNQPYLFHISRHSSELIASLDKVEHLVLSFVLQLIQSASALMIGILILWVLFDLDATSAALAAGLVLILYAIASSGVRGRLAANAQIIVSGYDRRLQAMQESLGGIRDVIIDRSQDAHVRHFETINGPFMAARAQSALLSAAPRFLVESLGLILIATLALLVAGRPGGVLAALPILGALALGAQRLLPLASQIFGGWTSLTASRPILADVARLLRLPTRTLGSECEPLPLRDAVRFDKVAFRYPDRPHNAVNGISLEIPKGKRVALVGPTGSGKSTLADLLMGLIEPETGIISIDGTPLTHDRLPAWRAAIAHVPQAIFLADDSIARNIAIGSRTSEPDMERVRRAAGIAQLSAFVEQLPRDYETRVGERGVRLSGGQRQRLALARAIYKNGQLLVLDEATSALDTTTEEAVLAALDELTVEGRTIVIIAHRLTTVAKCDLVYQLEDGAIVRSGSFADVFDKPGALAESEL